MEYSATLKKEKSVNRMSVTQKNYSCDESAVNHRGPAADQTKYAIQISKDSSINQISEEDKNARQRIEFDSMNQTIPQNQFRQTKNTEHTWGERTLDPYDTFTVFNQFGEKLTQLHAQVGSQH